MSEPFPATTDNTYDDVPYPGQPFRQTHPGWLAAMAKLLSLPSPLPETCRVLELGCCDGGNIIPMAIELPDAKFVGVDYSAVQIDSGRQMVDRLGLKNIDLRPMSILDIAPDWGQFDFIISHGVFSWVPREVQEKILEVSGELLAPDGIAYISYNTDPGWHLRGIVRDMMRYHALRFTESGRRVQEARLILDFIAKHAVGANAEAYTIFLRSEAELLKKLPDHYLYHEHLEDHCEPFYFHEFVDRAQSHGLDYLAEARLGVMAPTNFGPTAERALAAIATNLIELEQFMDFLRNRTFRETLLRHADGRSANYTIEPKRLEGLYITSSARPQTRVVDLRAEIPVTFVSQSKFPLTTSNSLLKAALLCLVNEFPVAIQFESLLERARAQLRQVKVNIKEPLRDASRLGAALLTVLTTSDLLEISSLPGKFTTAPGPRPRASSLARLQAENLTAVSTGRHDSVQLHELEPAVLKLLDGTRTPAEIAAALKQPEARIPGIIEHLAKCALIVG